MASPATSPKDTLLLMVNIIMLRRFGDKVPFEVDTSFPDTDHDYCYFVRFLRPLEVDHLFEKKTGSHSTHFIGSGSTRVPQGTDRVMVRIPKSQATEDKVETCHNEIAWRTHVLNALFDSQILWRRRIIPLVYAWFERSEIIPSSEKEKRVPTFIMEEVPLGTPLEPDFAAMPIAQKQDILVQIARVYKFFQDHKLPGNARFGRAGQLMPTGMTFWGEPDTGVWDTYETMALGQLKARLQVADDNAHIKGWRGTELRVRERLDDLLFRGLRFEKLTKSSEKCLVHGALTLKNILYDRGSNTVTCLVNFRHVSVSHPSHEFIHFLDGRFIHRSLIEGNKVNGGLPLLDASDPAKLRPFGWDTVRLWNETLHHLKIPIRPRKMTGFEKVAVFFQLISFVVPWSLRDEPGVTKNPKKIRQRKDKAEEILDELLKYLGV